MNARQRRRIVKLVKAVLPVDEFAKVEAIDLRDLGFGFDAHGMERETAMLGFAMGYYVHKYYFRARTRGHENIPADGPVLITPNHSGVLPFDGAMIWVDLIMKLNPPRAIRAVVDNFFPSLPFVSTFLQRAGQVVGARRNLKDLLDQGEAVALFPEGASGTGKFVWRRYRLLRFNVGFVEFALEHRAPIVPTAVVGGEEQAPMLANIKPLARMFGLPYFPITPFFPHFLPLGALPLPVQYHIHYGEPFHFYRDYGPEAAKDPEIVRMLADRVRMRVQDMVTRALDERETVFGFSKGLRLLPRRAASRENEEGALSGAPAKVEGQKPTTAPRGRTRRRSSRAR